MASVVAGDVVASQWVWLPVETATGDGAATARGNANGPGFPATGDGAATARGNANGPGFPLQAGKSAQSVLKIVTHG
jgi:hypothetical protein